MLKNLLLVLLMLIISLSAFAVDPVAPTVPTVPVQSNFMFYFAIVVTCLLAISEALGSIPSIKQNGIFQVISSILNALVVKKQAAIEKQKRAEKINSENIS